MISYQHIPVLCTEVVEWLVTDPDGIYCDGTLGGGGHTAAIAQKLTSRGSVIGLDRDATAIQAAQAHLARLELGAKVHIHQLEFAQMKQVIAPNSLAGILLDLGVSSYQLDTPTRGFSFRGAGPLDMRMDTRTAETAADLLNHRSEQELATIFYQFGEERHSRRIARQIVQARTKAPLKTTAELAQIVRHVVGDNPYTSKSLARIFQALRIAVNDELNQLTQALHVAIECLRASGRLVVISYHSLEDRIVKNIFRDEEKGCICPPKIPHCVCGRKPTLRRLTKKPIYPSATEIEHNSRARSARLRVAEKRDIGS